MKPINNIEKIIRKKLNFAASAEMRERILTDVINAQEDSKKNKSASIGPNIRNIIMRSPITKLTAAAMIVIAVVLLVTISEKTITPTYAIEKTINALKNVRFLHLIRRNQSGEIFDERWIELDSDGRQVRYRQDNPPDFLDIEDGETVAMYHKDKKTVVLYDPKEKGLTMGPISKFLNSVAEQKLIIDENVEYLGRLTHRVRSLMANQDVFVDPETFLPIAWAGIEISYENPPKGTFEILIPDGYLTIDKKPSSELTDEPEWLKEYEAADKNFMLGIQALSNNELETAVSLFKHVVTNQPRRNWAWYWLGRAHYEMGEYDLAIYEYTKTLEIVGSFSYCYYSRALAYSQKGIDGAAKEDLDKALPWMILALRHPEATTMFELADQPFGGKPYQGMNKEAQVRMINRLQLATGNNFGYNPEASAEENEQAISAWENWFENLD
jgi:tetratricopeptide (TPR) repeat protein